ncbi:MAG: hypothetical protein COA42_19065, partial [Alteromonadaceae bacterium]
MVFFNTFRVCIHPVFVTLILSCLITSQAFAKGSRKTSALVDILTTSHYSNKAMDDAFSEEFFDHLSNTLDPEK